MSRAQLLLRGLLDEGGSAAETGAMLVIDGEGLEELPSQMSTPKGVYQVHRVGSELGLRHLLWKANGAPLIAVMPDPVARRVQLAPDILRRARRQRIHALTINDVLQAVLGVRVVGADAPYLQELALEHVERLGRLLGHRTLPTVIDRRLLTELLVDVSVGERVRTQRPAELCAAWVEAPPTWSPNVSRLVRDYLPTLHADEGRVLAWALEEPETRLAELVIHGAVLTVEAVDVPKAAWGPLSRLASVTLQMDPRILRRVVTALAEETLTVLGDRAGPLLTRADSLARTCVPAKDLETSRVLPLAFNSRCFSLASGAAAGKPISAADIAWLRAHRAAPLHRPELSVLEAMGRVSRYLDRPFVPPTDTRSAVLSYQQGGAFLDLAVSHLRRALAESASYHVEAGKVLRAARERRDRENKHFAESLAGGYEKALHADGLTPLHRIWKRLVLPVWEKEPEAQVFLVVLDGCSYPVFLELLFGLSQDNTFPIGITPDADGRVAGLPALSPLPTITSHARGAIFLGELPKDPFVAETVFRDQDEAKTDKGRWSQNADLGTRTRKLFLKGDLGDGGQELRTTLGDPSVAVVGVVFNAVDDQIGSSNTGSVVALRPEDITGFKPALRAALLAGRKVLITADHGHSPYVDKELRMGAGKTPRYLGLAKDESPPEGFLEIDVQGLGGPPGRRAFAWRSGVYLGGPQVGFHGGAGLEEMVVPLAWLTRGGLYADEPLWWYGPGSLPLPRPEPKPVKPPIAAAVPSDELPAKPKPQLSLFDPSDKADQLPLPEALRNTLSKDEKAVLVLLRENGSARATELGQRLSRNPSRLQGLLSKLRGTLHAQGHVLFTWETLPDGEILYRYQGKDQDS